MAEGKAGIAWVSTRKASVCTDSVASYVTGRYLLYPMLTQVRLPLDELAQNQLVAIEIPSVSNSNYEHDVLRLVSKVRSVGPHVLLII